MAKIITVAEIGVNWDSVEMAKKMILEAKRAGADLVKMQMYSENEIRESPYYDELRKRMLTPELVKEFKQYSEHIRIEWFCTPMNLEAVDILNELGVKKFKVRERDSENYPLINKVLETDKTVFISTTRLPTSPHYLYHPNIRWLYATPKYPYPIEEVELYRIPAFRGISDHTQGWTLALASAAIAVSCDLPEFIIEKHITLSHDLPCIDANVSIDFKELSELIKHVRVLEKTKSGKL